MESYQWKTAEALIHLFSHVHTLDIHVLIRNEVLIRVYQYTYTLMHAENGMKNRELGNGNRPGGC